MSRTRVILLLIVAVGLAGVIVLLGMIGRGFSAADPPSALEAFAARSMRRFAVPADLRNRNNPVEPTPAVLAEARAHWADHCAGCHGNDGKGSDMGKKMYPSAPDMTLQSTQEQSDGELFATIENGIRLTGMPAFGSGTAESAYGSWTLVHFVRHLPKLTRAEIAEMEKLNPKPPAEYERMKAEEAFLAGETTTPPPATAAAHQH